MSLVFHQGERVWFRRCKTGAIIGPSLGLAEDLGGYVYCFYDGGSGGGGFVGTWKKEVWANHSTRTVSGLGNGGFSTLGPAVVVLVHGVAIMKLMLGKNRGFTLMELLVVVAVMMILAVLGLSSYLFSIKKSHDVVRKSDLAAIAKGLEAFANDFTVYPDDDGAGKIKACDSGAGLVACSWGDPMTARPNGTAQTYLIKIPKDPVSGQYYYYIKTTDGFKLYAGLENISDPSYADAGISCGAVNCSYTLTQAGVQ